MMNLLAQSPSDRELISHVVRRLGIGANPAIVESASDVAEAISLALVPAVDHEPPSMAMPTSWEEAYDDTAPITKLTPWWIDRMVASESPIHERMTWFWHDHFATRSQKADVAWMLWKQLETIRSHALGNFADMLKAIARDPAMLVYLDGESNNVEDVNENFGREVMELYTLGIGNYTQEDVVAAARCFTGWVVNYPDDERGVFDYPDTAGWEAVFEPQGFDSAPKLLLGRRGRFSMDDALDIMLDHPSTGPFVAGKLYRELVGIAPDAATAERLGKRFAEDYEIMPLIEAIIAERVFLSAEAVRVKVRTPLEKVVSVLQAFGQDPELDRDNIVWWMEEVGYAPFNPPNPSGYPRGKALLGPATLAGSFVLLGVLSEPTEARSAEDLFARFVVYDVSKQSRKVVEQQDNPGSALALAFASPEFSTT